MSFFEVEFPRTILFERKGSVAGWSTTVNTGFTPQENRNKNWQDSRGEWNVGLMTPVELNAQRQQFVDWLIDFFDAVQGRGDGFRFYDHLACKATNQLLVTYNGQVQLALTRSMGSRSYQKIITKPMGTLNQPTDYKGNTLANTVFLHGTTTPVTCDSTTGIVTGQSAGTAVDFQYHIPVRFDVDKLPLVVKPSFVKGGNPLVSLDLPIVEVPPPNY